MPSISYAVEIRNNGSDSFVGQVVTAPSTRPVGGVHPPITHIEDVHQIGAPVTITGATNAAPISVTATAHGYSSGDQVWITSVGGNTNANGGFVITVVDANTFTLDGSSGNAGYTSGGVARKVPATKNLAALLNTLVETILNYEAAGN